MIELSAWELEALEQLLTGGIRQSLESLAKLSSVSWRASGLRFEHIPARRLLEKADGLSARHPRVLVSTQSGPLYFLLTFESKGLAPLLKALCDYYRVEMESLDDSARPMLEELSNIVVGSFLKSLAESSKRMLVASVPCFIEGSRKDQLESALADLDRRLDGDESLLLAGATLYSEPLSADCDCALLAGRRYLRGLIESVTFS
ncbi:MAG: hypothetical protein HY549_08480 [Elusimicrobia bacterium]|nr:hypothetical protein [Elusimicrobiota bacterium]